MNSICLIWCLTTVNTFNSSNITLNLQNTNSKYHTDELIYKNVNYSYTLSTELHDERYKSFYEIKIYNSTNLIASKIEIKVVDNADILSNTFEVFNIKCIKNSDIQEKQSDLEVIGFVVLVIWLSVCCIPCLFGLGDCCKRRCKQSQ